MQKEVQKFFIDLEQKRVNKENNIIQLNSDRITRVKGASGLLRYNIDGTYAFIKDDDLRNIIYGIASSKMYNDIGITMPKTCLIQDKNGTINLASQDIRNLASSKIDVTLGINTPLYKKFLQNNWRAGKIRNKWNMLFDDDARLKFLHYMTPECLDEFIGLYPAGELLTNGDLHWQNVFFYKPAGSDLYEGVIPIDLEFVNILLTKNIAANTAFKEFLSKGYSTYTPTEHRDSVKTYPQRMRAMQENLQEGNFSPNQIDIMTRMLNYDFPETIKQISQKYSLPATRAYNTHKVAEKLWQYNRAHIGRDLGL